MANTYLSRTFGSAGNRQSWTWSGWIKKSKVYNSTSSSDREVWFGGYSGNNDTDWLEFGTQGDVFYFTTNSIGNTGNRLMRDSNAWFHAVVTYDGSNLKFYYNNELDFNNTQLSGNRGINAASIHTIGTMPKNAGTLRFFSGVMSHVHFVDGSILAPSVFGETDATTGEWKIITSPSYTAGTNGFFILKDGNSGTDQSTNSNNFTAYGTLTKTEDCPSNVFCTMNPLDNYYPASSFTNGNNSIGTSSSNRSYNTGTLGASSGKYYWEVKCVSNVTASNGCYIGIASTNPTNNGSSSQQTLGYKQYDYGFASANGNINTNNSQSSYGNAYGDNDIIGVAMDLDNNKLYFHKNGTYENSGVPTSGSTGTGAVSIQAASGTLNGVYTPGLGDWWIDGFNVAFNFGNGYFGTTAVSSAGTNASGNGIFEYDVPTGYTALSTKGLNL
tara:strand:+ start:340 stop:1665 length:1326 start_codon:yes stop_codon:yes gene_type:complete